MSSHIVSLKEDPEQMKEDQSYIGGVPSLPPRIHIPCCKLCGQEQTFFFQVSFPGQHVWSGYTLAIFSCTSCVDEDHFIPSMLPGKLSEAIIPEGFLDGYQKNFAIIVFDSSKGVMKEDYKRKVKFKRIEFIENGDSDQIELKIGGMPNWYLEDETPLKYEDSEMHFLMQIPCDFEFDILPDAPKQVNLGFGKKITILDRPFYRLFLANYLYFFGSIKEKAKVYILTQV